MSEVKIYKVQEEFQKRALIQRNDYEKLYQQSIKDPDAFWSEQANQLKWHQKWTKVKNTQFTRPIHVKWFENGKINACENCVDRHLVENSQKVAIYWEPDEPNSPTQTITYERLSQSVNRMANGLKEHGVKKGDRVTIYMPMIPEAVYAMLACARIGAIHSVVFAGFSKEALTDRIRDCESEFVITADEAKRGGKVTSLKSNVDQAALNDLGLKKVFVVKNTGGQVSWESDRDVWYHDMIKDQSDQSPVEVMDAEDPLFILYTSGSTSKPKGVLHTTGGYLTYVNTTFKYIFDYKPEDVYWCAADIGWVTGHSYMVYGPLSQGATMVLFEGLPSYPTPARIWQIVDKYKVNLLYTAPTLIRALMREGLDYVQESTRESLRLLGSVGEPINPEAWEWYYKNIGQEKCPIVDTWWQTETGGILISPLPGAMDLKPGSATRPFFGVQPVIVNEKGEELEGECEGYLCFKDSWPGQMRGVYKNPDRFYETYFSQYKGLYFSGDGCRRDADGDYWITGRVDDVLNVSGHRMGTAEIESALVGHPSVSEAAVVGFPHEIKGQGIYCFVTLMSGQAPSDKLADELIQTVRKEIGPFAKPDKIQWAPALPKTRSGKIMRRILRKIAEGHVDQIGDTSTLADAHVIDDLVRNRGKE